MAGSTIERVKNNHLIRFYLGVEYGKPKYYSEIIGGSKSKAEARLRE